MKRFIVSGGDLNFFSDMSDRSDITQAFRTACANHKLILQCGEVR